MRKIKSLSLLFVLALSVSACGLNNQKQTIENNVRDNEEKFANESQSNIEQKEEEQKNKDDVFNPIGDHMVDRSIKSDTREGWLVYHDNDYGIEFEYPDYFYVSDCSCCSNTSIIHLDDFKSINTCNGKGGRINVLKSNKILELPYLKESVIVTKNGSYIQLLGSYEMFGPEGEKHSSEPMQFAFFTYVPYKDAYLNVSYGEIFSVKEENEFFKVQKNYRREYEEIIQSFKILE